MLAIIIHRYKGLYDTLMLLRWNKKLNEIEYLSFTKYIYKVLDKIMSQHH